MTSPMTSPLTSPLTSSNPSTAHYFASPVHVTVELDGEWKAGIMEATRAGEAFVRWSDTVGQWVPHSKIRTGADVQRVYAV